MKVRNSNEALPQTDEIVQTRDQRPETRKGRSGFWSLVSGLEMEAACRPGSMKMESFSRL
jgi:hypothetical protein